MLHSQTIKDYKSRYFLIFKDIKLIYYVIHNNPTLLHQTNDVTNKVYEKNQPVLTVINGSRHCLYVLLIVLLMFSPENTCPIQIW